MKRAKKINKHDVDTYYRMLSAPRTSSQTKVSVERDIRGEALRMASSHPSNDGAETVRRARLYAKFLRTGK